jgi:regulatory protein
MVVIVEDNDAAISYQFCDDRMFDANALMSSGPVDTALIERWALSYLGRYANSAEGLRRVLMRRARKRLGEDREALTQVADAIAGVVARYQATGLVDDAAFAGARARAGLRRGQSLRAIRGGLAAKGVGAEDAAVALDALRQDGDPDLAAACAFARRRRLGAFSSGSADRQKELAAFARAGFSRATAEAVLACATPEEAEGLVGGSDE